VNVFRRPVVLHARMIAHAIAGRTGRKRRACDRKVREGRRQVPQPERRSNSPTAS
jgi:hypothetical protein